MKKSIVLIFAVFLLISFNLNFACFAKDDSGNIDFYKAFSKSSENINMIGNRIYNWSIYFPSDSTIDKTPKATIFSMNTSSFKANVAVNVFKNIHNLTLEQIYASIQNDSSSNSYDYYSYDYKCSSAIQTDSYNNKFIRTSSITPDSSYLGTTDSTEEKGIYSEERIFINKYNNVNYIYKLDISMDLAFYKLHQNLFSKLADSFRTSFDSSNPDIKDLSDLATSYRSFENKVYGWKIELAPYWKSQNQQTSTTMLFKPLYSSEEIGSDSQDESSDTNTETSDKSTGEVPAAASPDNNAPASQSTASSTASEPASSSNDAAANPNDSADSTQNNTADSSAADESQPSTEQQSEATDSTDSKVQKIDDSLSVSFVSSVPTNETFSQWVNKEFNTIRTNYNSALYSEHIVSQQYAIQDSNKKLLVYKIKSTSKDTFVVGLLLVQGNNYRYKVALRMNEKNFNDPTNMETFFRMLKSFTLTNNKSSFVQQVAPVESVLNPDSAKVLSLKNFNLKIASNNNWVEPFDLYEGQLEDYSYGYDPSYDSGDESEDTSSEQLSATHTASGATLSISAKICDRTDADWSDEFLNALVPASPDPTFARKVFSATYNDIKVIKVSEEYNIKKMEQETASESRKFYNYSTLYDTYTYAFKAGEEEYTIILSIPALNTSDQNEKLLNTIWNNVVVNKINLGSEVKDWSTVTIKSEK